MSDPQPDLGNAPQLSPTDVDLITRTVLGEAGNQPPIGQAAVAHVVINRLASGDYGNSVRDVLFSKDQFEPWTTRAGELLSISPSSPQYKQAATIVDGVLSGKTDDPTGGATHFLNPIIVRQRTGGTLPDWAQGQGLQIGAHTFYAPHGPVDRGDALSAINAVAPQPAPLAQALPYTATGSPQPNPKKGSAPVAQTNDNDISDADLLKLYGPKAPKPPQNAAGESLGSAAITAPPAVQNAPASPQSSPAQMSDADLLKMYGPKVATDGTGQPGTLDQTRAAIPPAAVGQIEILASSRQLPDKIADRSIANIATATGADPQALRGYYDAFKARPVSGDEAFAQGAKQGVTLGTAPAIGGAFDALSGERPFAQGMASRVADLKAAEAQHPYAALGGEVAGTIAGLAPIGATAIGGRALGLTGGNMLTRMGASAGTNALIGGADAAIRSGGDPSQTVQGAGWGGLLGGIAPPAGYVVGKGVNMLTSAIGNPLPGARAVNALTQALDNSRRPIADVQAELARNPRLALMDVDPNLQQIAGGLASKPGQARATLNAAYQARTAGAPDAVAGAYDAALGATPDTKVLLDSLKATARQNAQKGFGEALDGAKDVNLNGMPLPYLEKINSTLKSLSDQDPNFSRLSQPEQMHRVQSALRTEAETLSNSASGSDRLAGNSVGNIRRDLVDRIDTATGGKFKVAQTQYADDKSIQDAFNKGLDVFQNRAGQAGLQDRPEYWRAAIADMSPDEQAALKQGVRVAADQKIGSVRNAARAGTAITDSDMNTSKLSAILGERETAQLAQRMADEQQIAKTNSALFQGSQTEPRRQGVAATAVRQVAPLSMEIGLPTFAGLTDHHMTAAAMAGLALARRGVGWLGQRSDLARNNLLAEYLSASGPDTAPVFGAINNQLASQGNFGRLAGLTGNLLIDASRHLTNASPPMEKNSRGGPPR